MRTRVEPTDGSCTMEALGSFCDQANMSHEPLWGELRSNGLILTHICKCIYIYMYVLCMYLYIRTCADVFHACLHLM